MNELTTGGPDPTILTTEQLHREIEALRREFSNELASTNRLNDERFAGIRREFINIECQRIEQKSDTKAAVDAALTSAKEAVKEQTIASERAIAKSETATTKQLEQLSVTFTAIGTANRRDIDDLKNRTTALVEREVGAGENRTGIYALAGFILTILLIVGVIVGFAAKG